MITIIIPCLNEEQNILEVVKEIREVLLGLKIDFEILFVDDGSKDNSWQVISNLNVKFDNIHGIRFSRNFGKEAAVVAAIEKVNNSDAVIIMDCDMQHPVKLLPEMIDLWGMGKVEIVEAVKFNRQKVGLFYSFFSRIFLKFLMLISGMDLMKASDYKLIDRKVINEFKKMPERNIFFRGMMDWLGYTKKTITFEVAERKMGASKFSIKKLFLLAVTSITSFSSIPLHLVSLLGLTYLSFSIILSVRAVYVKFSHGTIDGITLVILLLLFTGSFIMIALGIIGTYIARIFEEVKQRPRYVISSEI